MPAIDPLDQAAARDFEQMLRYYVHSGRSPQAKLDWFLALPKRVRRSCILIGAVLGPYEEAQQRVREEEERRRTAELERMLNLAATRSQPRDLSFLHVGHAWNGLGCRKRHCRAFCVIGQAYSLHKRLEGVSSPSVHQSLAPPSPIVSIPVQSLELDLPMRPSTPEGLREAVFNQLGLLAVVNGPGLYGHTPDNTPATPPLALGSYPPPVHPGALRPGLWVVGGMEINPDFAYIVALG